MLRFLAVAVAALAYLLSTLLMPALRAQAAGMPTMPMSAPVHEMAEMNAPAHCLQADEDRQAQASSHLARCLLACAVAHAPALPSQAPAALLRWSRQAPPLARPHARPAAIVVPDPRPPRRLFAAL